MRHYSTVKVFTTFFNPLFFLRFLPRAIILCLLDVLLSKISVMLSSSYRKPKNLEDSS